MAKSNRNRSGVAPRAPEGAPAAGLCPWREIVAPHPDVAGGTWQQAEFAADLWQVHTRIADPSYGDAQEFFRRTYLTEGLRRLLTNALNRIGRARGDPVVALQANFGGGKTHSLLALYHLFGDVDPTRLAGVGDLGPEAEARVGQPVNRAVLVGNKIPPGRSQLKPDGIRINTLWGELAWQLGGADGYALVREADRTRTNPGADLRELFHRFGPCLILIDEWVAYARQLYTESDLPAGTFDTQFTFAQELTEQVKAADHALLVVSIPSSDAETGGSGGRHALARLENVVSRTEAAWQPATTEEGLEIVRRRLFEPIESPETLLARDAVVREFARVYRANRAAFPADCGSGDYETRMQTAYPIHPEVFDRLFEDWSTLASFQGTRGVLRLMAAVVHELWRREDRSLLILPGAIPMDAPAVRTELTRYLGPGWSRVIEADVDGPGSTPLSIDQRHVNLGRYAAARRVARTVFFGTAPLEGTARRAKDPRTVNLGCAQPGESFSAFGDALRRLQNEATYLFADGNRTWFDRRPNINRDAESRKHAITDDAVAVHIAEVLQKRGRRDKGPFRKIHVAPRDSGDVEDDRAARLVILDPDHPHVAGDDASPALERARALLENRGTGARLYRNTLVFVAADRARLEDLKDAARWYLAWKEIDERKDELDLDSHQSGLARTKRKEFAETIAIRIPETFEWLLVPRQPTPTSDVTWEASRIKGGRPIAERAARKLRREEDLVDRLGGVRLRMDLDRVPLWDPGSAHVPVKQLRDYYARYLYLSRLEGPHVLEAAIQDGVNAIGPADEGFGVAASYDRERDRYHGLKIQERVVVDFDEEDLLVRGDVAARQRAIATPPAAPAGDPGRAADAAATPKRVVARVRLDPGRVDFEAGRIAEHVIAHLEALPDVTLDVTLEIEAHVNGELDETVRRTVTENCRTLGFERCDFD